jgi:hypothetical protein
MSRLVMDTLFVEIVTFRMPQGEFRRCSCALSQEEVLRQAMEYVGLELIDYDSYIAQPLLTKEPRVKEAFMGVTAYSRAYRERAERATAAR